MPQLYGFVHYRIVDVSSLKLLVRHWYPNAQAPAKTSTHRALDDIEESIDELRYYQSILTGTLARSAMSDQRRALTAFLSSTSTKAPRRMMSSPWRDARWACRASVTPARSIRWRLAFCRWSLAARRGWRSTLSREPQDLRSLDPIRRHHRDLRSRRNGRRDIRAPSDTRQALQAALTSFTGSFAADAAGVLGEEYRRHTRLRSGAQARCGGGATEASHRDGAASRDPRRSTARRAQLLVEAGAGFYVRSLAHDLGTVLQTGAVLDALRRIQSGDFGLDNAVGYDELVTSPRESLLSRLVPFDRLLSGAPAVVARRPVGAPRAPWAGCRTVRRCRRGAMAPEMLVRLLDGEGRLVALAKPAGERGFLHASVVFG